MVENKKFFVCYLLALALSVGCNIAQRNLMSGGMDMGISLSIRLTKKLKTVYKEVYDKKIKDVETSIGHADCITHNGTSEHIGAKAKVVRSLSSQKKIYEV
ncbi:hypothetical protein [Cardinium endosymbiont of Philonthus spinipes]|uniref:hypothetical protein n=1 Tax=Cardinium endosymbiont of Philonthus spinipes TaxID=3077941 RepID=UPI00313C7185